MFTWRLKHESLAFRSNLKKRGIPVDDTKCLFCGKAEEDWGHLFIKCKHVKGVWRALAMEQEREELQEITSVHHVLDYIWRLSEIKRLHILTFWWLWWSNRNKLREGELPEAADEVARRTRANVMEYMQILSAPSEGKVPY
ncbi:Threonine dehydratase [Hordeum vulgare]|nr:Threonine dehydratase [Hordeum vulgare]